MARGKKKEAALSLEEKLERALVPESEQPYPIPENWCWTRLKTVAHLYNGDRGVNYPSKKDYIEFGIPFINAGAIQNNSLDDTAFNYITEEKYESLRAGKIQQGDILYCLRGSLGKTALIKNNIKGAISSSLCILRVQQTLLREYLAYLMQSEVVRKQQDVAENGSAQPNLSAASVMEYMLPIPPLGEQQRIVDRIECLFAQLDEAKEKAQAVVDSFETRKAAILHKAFTGELTAKWRTEHGVGMDSWKNTKFRDFCLLKRGFDLPASQRMKGDYPLVSSSGIIDSHNVAAVKGPGVVTGRSGSIGKVFYVEQDYWPLNTTLYSEKLFGNDARYVSYYLQTFDFKSFSSSTAVPTLNRNLFLDEMVYVPSVNEQLEIVRILDAVFAKEQQAKETAEAVLEQIDLLKKSILARAFCGELGTNDPTEESAEKLIKKILLEKISEDRPGNKRVKRKPEVGLVEKTIMHVLSKGSKLTPEKLKSETGLQVDDFYEQLKVLIDSELVIETRINGESYLEARDEDRQPNN